MRNFFILLLTFSLCRALFAAVGETSVGSREATDLARLRVQLDDAANYSVRLDAWHGIVAIGDEQGIRHLMDLYHAGDGDAYSLLDDSGNEIVLPYLMEDVYNGPTALRTIQSRTGPFKYTVDSIRDTSAHMVYRIVAYISGSKFPVATREWMEMEEAAIWTQGKWKDGFAASLKLWWEHNKEAILAKDYAKATWLPPGADRAVAAWKEKLATANPDPFAPATAQSAPAIPPKNPAPVSPLTSPAPPEPSPVLKWLLAAVTLAALGLGWRLLRRK